jgi:CDP-paratose 2-epimerase
MKYLITGGCGFIGVNFADKLLERGDKVTLVDNLSRKGTVANLKYLQEKYPEVIFEHADVRIDYEKLLKLMEGVDAVYHLAGQVAVTFSVTDPRKDFEENALGTFNVLEAVRNSEKKPLMIYASTNKVYGGMEDVEVVEEDEKYTYKDFPNGIPEDRLLDFHSPYGCSKGAADQYVRDYGRIYDLDTIVMRQSCIYGTRQFGIEDQGWVAWFTIAKVLGWPITIYGNGKQVRDVLFVEDLFDAWDIATKKIDKARGHAFNVGGSPSSTLSLLELIDLLNEEVEQEFDISYSEWRPGDQPVYISDISKIKEALGWEPKVDVKQGVKKMVAWIKENEALIRQQLGK